MNMRCSRDRFAGMLDGAPNITGSPREVTVPRFRPILLAAALLAIAATTAQAQATYDACYVPSVGAIYLIKQAGLPSACLAQGHVQFTWTDGGTLPDGSVTTAKLADGAVTAAKLAFNPATQAELNALAVAGTINASTNPVDWTQLKNVPAGFADGVDASGGTSDHGTLTGLTDDDHPQYLLGNGARVANDGFAVTGTFGTGALAATGAGIRLLWYPRKAAFRAGSAFGTAWDDANIGLNSVGLGATPIARGDYSVALGLAASAGGVASTAIGPSANASGDSSTAIGIQTTASNVGATATGNGTTASGHSATAMGTATVASGSASTALGASTVASGQTSTAMGIQTVASGIHSTAMGFLTRAESFASVAIGRFNALGGDPTNWVLTDPLFVVGNGVTTRLNALTLFKNGNLSISGTFSQSSDIRLKQDIEPLTMALNGVSRLQPISYRFRDGTGHPTERQIGLAAQDVERVFPELVSRDAQGYLSVSYTQLAAVLVRAVQEQQDANATLRAEVAALRAELLALSAAVGRLERR